MNLKGIDKQELKKLIQIVVEDTLERNEKKQHRDEKIKKETALFNTKLLVKKYRELKAHCDIIPQQIEELSGHSLDEEKMSLDTLMTEKAKTYSMMIYVDAALNAYKDICFNSGDPAKERRCVVVDRLFISHYPLNVEELMELKGISQRQVYNDRDKGINEIATVLFGVITLPNKQCKKSAKRVQK